MTEQVTVRDARPTREPCAECGALCEPGEYHPYAFCALQKANLNPWHELRVIAGQLGLGDPGEEPPKVWEIRNQIIALDDEDRDRIEAMR